MPVSELCSYRGAKQAIGLHGRRTLQAIQDEICDYAALHEEGKVTDLRWERFLEALALLPLVAKEMKKPLPGGFGTGRRDARKMR